MNTIYFGIWQNLYQLNWCIRFFIELAILFTITLLIIKILNKTLAKFKFKEYFVQIGIAIVTKITFFIRKKSNWTSTIDQKMTNWINNTLSDNKTAKKHIFILILFVIIYFLGIWAELPFNKNYKTNNVTELTKIKYTFQNIEYELSKGYESYPPLFAKKATGNNDYTSIKLNSKGIKGSNIRKGPSTDYSVIFEVEGDIKILYQDQWEFDGDIYWLKVYLPEDEIEGWLSGRLINQKQLEQIISKQD